MRKTYLQNQIVQIMTENGLTERAWAVKAGLSATAVKDIRLGKSRSPKAETIAALASAAGVPMSRLLPADALAVPVDPVVEAQHIQHATQLREIGARIRAVREVSGVGSAQLSEAVTGDRTALERIEAGLVAPTALEVINLAFRLRVSTDLLLRGSFESRIDGDLMLELVSSYRELWPLPKSRGPRRDMDPT